MNAKKMRKLSTIILLFFLCITASTIENKEIPLTGQTGAVHTDQFDTFIGYSLQYGIDPEKTSISQFIESIKDGYENTIRGVYATDIMALQVLQQPSSNAGFVSGQEGTATQFSMASQYNSIGLLAHNYASGRHFFDLSFGNIIQVVYGDGDIELYKVAEIYRYQALSPNSARSNFKDLVTGQTYTATQVFYQMYTGGHHLTLQTCIQQDDVDSWGRLFIIAYPL